MEGLATLLGIEDRSWVNLKKEILGAHYRLMQRLTLFDKTKISAETREEMQQYINNPQFLPQHVMRASVAAGAMCAWVLT